MEMVLVVLVIAGTLLVGIALILYGRRMKKRREMLEMVCPPIIGELQQITNELEQLDPDWEKLSSDQVAHVSSLMYRAHILRAHLKLMGVTDHEGTLKYLETLPISRKT